MKCVEDKKGNGDKEMARHVESREMTALSLVLAYTVNYSPAELTGVYKTDVHNDFVHWP